MSLWSFVYLFKESSIQILCPFLNWAVILLFTWKSSLYILDARSLSDIGSANVFSQSVVCLFVFLMMALKYKTIKFDEVSSFSWKYLKVEVFNLSIFYLMNWAFGVVYKNFLPNPKSWRFSPMFSSKNFIILAPTCRSSMDLGLIFVYGVR